MQKDKNRHRYTVLSLVLVVVMLLYCFRMYDIQIVNASTYIEQLAGISTRISPIKAPRGEILDCYGREIAINREGYNIVFHSAYFKKSDMNKTIDRLTILLSKNNLKWTDELDLSLQAPYDFSGSEADTKKLRKNLGLADYATAEDCFKQMVKKYSLEDYPKNKQRIIMGVRYSMEISSFTISNPFIFAEDITSSVMTKVTESGFLLAGVAVEIAQFREYSDPTFAPHIIGTVGAIPEEDWQKYKKKGYSLNDKVGTSGIELSEEENLHGIDGEITYKIDSSGNIISTTITKEPIPGNTVMLTLDKTMQLAAQNQLAATIDELKSKGGTATGGAVVAVRVNTGSVLLSATYPSYTINQAKENYSALLADKNTPLLNRAFNGIYPSGSALKPAIAIAGLEENRITPTETINCTRRYTVYKDYQPSCMHRDGPTSLNKAISKSCNFYFFETGNRLGIDLINKYLKAFGFGQRTGVEVADSVGILSQPGGENAWFAGDTLRVSIGQMNAYTPIQLANYTATIANGGTRYKTTLVERVMSYDLSKQISANEKKVLGTVEISPQNLNAVKKAMLSVTEDGTGSAAFKNYPIEIGGKTGTAQTTGADHSVFIAFAPFESPEIAICIIIEHGASSRATTSTVRSVLDSYFFTGADKYKEDPTNTLID